MSATYVLHKGDITKEFESREEFDEMVQLLEEQDVDFETETAEDAADASEGDTNVEVVDDTDKLKEGYEKASEKAVEESMPEPSELTSDPLDIISKNAEQFTDVIKGTVTINRQGYAVLAERFGISVEAEPITLPGETDFEYAEFKAIAETEDGKTYTGYGSAHVDRGDDAHLLGELAETRSMKRATAWATGVGMTAASELSGGNPDK